MSRITIPGVVLGEELRRGSNSIVYRAERAGRQYALKMPLRQVADDKGAMRSFAREATVLACINHPNISHVWAAGRAAGFPYLITDLVEGDSLESRIRSHPLGVGETTRIALDLASALHEAHRRGLVHQGVTPMNIIIRPSGRVMLLDFGLMAKAGRLADETAVGTLLYSAPEQTGMLHREVDARADLYALGAVLYHCLAGAPPFEATDAAELMRLHAVTAPKSLACLRTDVTEELAGVVARLLSKDPDDRYPSARDVASALLPLASGPVRKSLCPSAASEASWMTRTTVGRQQPRALLRRAWSDCLAGKGGVVTVIGEAGAGKTQLVRELATTPGLMAGRPVLRGRCAPQASVPFALLRDLIGGHLRDLSFVSEPRRRELLDRVVAAAGKDTVRLSRLHPLLDRALNLEAPRTPEPEADELRFRAAVVGLLGRLAALSGGMLIWVDDAHWLSPGDRAVLESLAASAYASRLLIVNTTRDPSLRLATGLARSWEIALKSLTGDEVSALIRAYLGEITDENFAREVAVRSSGNPLAVVSYVQAVIDAGLVRPDWGHFALDRSELESLPLPVTVLDLIRRRADALSPRARSILGVAAVIGRRFSLGLLAAVSASTPALVTKLMSEAEAHQLAVPNGDDTWSFVHDCVHEALVSTMAMPLRRTIHRRVVDVLDSDSALGRRGPYEAARHAIAGELDPPRRFRLVAAAATEALAAAAPYDAFDFYEAALAAALEAGLEPGADFEEGFAVACARTVHASEARAHFLRALGGQHEALRRASIYLELARVEAAGFHTAAACEYVHRGLLEIGRRLPDNPLEMAAVSVTRLLVGTACRWSWTGYGRVTGDKRKLDQLRCRLYDVGAQAEWSRGRMGSALAFMMSAVTPRRRLGSGDAYLRSRVFSLFLVTEFGRGWPVERTICRLRTFAEQSNDPLLRATIDLYIGGALLLGGRNSEAEDVFTECLSSERRWIETAHYANSKTHLIRSRLQRGLFREAWDACETQSGNPGDEVLRADLAIVRARLARILGFPPIPDPGLAALDEEPAAERLRRHVICGDVAESEIEDGEFGHVFDAAVAAGDSIGFRPRQVPKSFRYFWVAKARGRLEQARATPPGLERTRRCQAARRALREARCAGAYPPYAADLKVLRAVERELANDDRAALEAIHVAEGMARDLDLPRVRFDAILERARCLRAAGEIDSAETEADLALEFARRRGWVGRERRVLHEFPRLGQQASPREPVGTQPKVAASRYRRRLDAVLRVSAAAGQQTAPQRVAVVALDEIIAILGAERALLFLPEAAHGSPRPGGLRLYASRTRESGERDDDYRGELQRFATEVAERVRDQQRPLVATGSDEIAALVSYSGVQHVLRSIIAAPVPIDDQQVGVVYVDSRVARGLFTDEDAEILVVLAKQVGVSLQSAEKVRLESLVAAERTQRELAEALRLVTARAAATLDVTEIPGRVLTAARQILPFDAAWILKCVADGLRVDSIHGNVDSRAVGMVFAHPEEGPLAEALAGGEVTAVDGNSAPLPGQRSEARSLLIIPLPFHCRGQIMFVLASGFPDFYGDTRVQIAHTVVDQTAVAYQNAQMVEELRRHAATDPLTGLANRRQFFEQAARALARRIAAGEPTNAAMIDIDYFKKVNDGYGHSVGDEVLTGVARRIRISLCEEDLVGRVGGEEFAALLLGPLPAAEKRADRLRCAVAESPIETAAGPLTVHLSIGLTPSAPDDANLADFLYRADQALYTAKETGRNRVIVRCPKPLD
ncbi:histidine kinase [Frankia sp. R43]|uniref:diguanylate cyclase n=1 Tax=Frankia sp. R43 TaxID=269536 RepID=UPI0006CA4BF3|nr:diguanylate cyclase [Frankia sp. R43]KPM50612.1 histidine kinase [Frankia sp. R43]